MAYGSGDIGAWSGLTHNIVGDWSTATQGLIGDSITTLSWSAYSALFADPYKPAVNYWSGRPFAGVGGASEWLKAQVTLPERLFIACGTNDIFDPPAFGTELGVLLDHIEQNRPEVKQVILVTVQARRASQPVAVQWCDQMNSAWVNKFIYQEAAKRGSLLRVAQWSELFMSDKNRLTRYLQDGVHPTTSGAYVGTAAWAVALKAQYVPLPPPYVPPTE